MRSGITLAFRALLVVVFTAPTLNAQEDSVVVRGTVRDLITARPIAMRPTCAVAGDTSPCPFTIVLRWGDSLAIPRYPRHAILPGLGGRTTVRFTVESGGRIDTAKVEVRSATNRVFVAPIKSAMTRWVVDVPAAGRRGYAWYQELAVTFTLSRPRCPDAQAPPPVIEWLPGPVPELAIVECERLSVPRH